jgi:hypothetical protein
MDVDIFAITMVDQGSVLVSSRRNIDPQLQKRICLHSRTFTTFEESGRNTPNCGLDLIWIGQTPTAGSPRINSNAEILWTGVIQTGGWLRAVITLYSEKIRPLRSREQSALKHLTAAIKDGLIRFTRGPETQMPSKVAPPDKGQLLCFKLEHMDFVIRCFGKDRASQLQHEAASYLAQNISDIGRMKVVGLDRILLERRANSHPMSPIEVQHLCADALKAASLEAIPILIVPEDIVTLGLHDLQRPTNAAELSLMPTLQTRQDQSLVG